MDILLSIRSKADSSTREVKSAIGDGLVIGRGAEQGVLLDGPDLSREHLVLTADGTNIYVTDLSSNGTWLNGTRLKRSVKARASAEDLIEIPGYALSFRLADQPEKTVPVAQLPASLSPEIPDIAPPPPASPGLLGPVFRFIGSFTLLEKTVVIVGVGGLMLLFSYFNS